MSAKRPMMLAAGNEKKKRKAITLEQKLKIISQHEAGKSVTVIARDMQLSQSTISTILKDKTRIMDAVKSSASVHSTIISKKRTGPLEEMEALLVTWMEDQIRKRVPLSLLSIQAKARTLFDELKKRVDDASYKQEFVASHGWFQRFKNRHNFHSVKISGEAASADAVGAAQFREELHKIIVDENYLPEQIFNVDETGLYWKRMPERSYIHKEAKSMSGFKAFKDRLTLLLGGNVAGYKLKPFMIYHSANPRALARISKNMLPVHYRHNKKAWMTAVLFEDWFVNCFIPEVKIYCAENNIPFKILLILDNAPGHPQSIGDFDPNVKVVFMPPNTTSLIQPMDQGAVATFKAYYLRNTFAQAIDAMEEKDVRTFWKEFNVLHAIRNIGRAWKEVTSVCMNGIWKNLLKIHVNSFKGFEKDDALEDISKKIVSLGKSLEFEVEEEDIKQLINMEGEELSAEDLIELAEERKKAEEEEEDAEEIEEPEKKFTTKNMADAFAFIEKGIKMFEHMDVNYERFAKVERNIHDSLACYRLIYDERKKRTVQSTMDIFLKNAPSTSSTLESFLKNAPSTSSTLETFLKNAPSTSCTLPTPSPASNTEPQPSTSHDDDSVMEETVEEERIDDPAAVSSDSPPSYSDN